MSKPKLFIVNIHGVDHPVYANTKREAQSEAIADRVSTRLAELSDIIAISRSGQRIIGEPVADQEDVAQQPLIPAEQADTNEG